MMAHLEYKVFMAVVDSAGMDRKGNPLFQMVPDGKELVFSDEAIERVREGGEVHVRHVIRRTRRINHELSLVLERLRQFKGNSEVVI